MRQENLLTLFSEFERYAHDVAVVQRRGYRRETWSYKQFGELAAGCALEFQQRGVKTGDRVLLWGSNSGAWMAAFWGCLLRGAVAVPMDDGATQEFAARVARDAAVKLILAAKGKPTLDAAIPTLALEELAEIAVHRQVCATQIVDGERRRSVYQSFADEPITRKHVAQILFTSGTTSEPRGVVLTHGNFLANLEPLEAGIRAYGKYERWFHPLRFVTLIPLSHVFGQVMGLFVPPLQGAVVVLENTANPNELIRTIKRERATALIAVPRMLDLLRSGIEREFNAGDKEGWYQRVWAAAAGKKFLRRAWIFRRVHRGFGWKFWAFICGGAALRSDTEEFFKRMGFAVVQGYGMTETASLISLNHPFSAAEGSVGRILPGRDFRLAEDGEILVRGENVSSGYWEKGGLQNSPSEMMQGAEEGWLHTGDIGELDGQGNLRFRGRKKSVIVSSSGLNIYPEDLESALRKQSGMRDCVVIPLAKRGDSEACAVLLPEMGYEAAAEAAIAAANASLAEYQRIREWVVWPEADFPRTATGKPRLAIIAERAATLLSEESRDGRKQAGSRGRKSPLDGVLEEFAAMGRSVELGERLELTSLDRVELMSALEEKFHVELDESAFAAARTAGDVERLLQKPAGRSKQYSYPRWAQRKPVRWLRLAVYYTLVWPATQILAHPKIIGREHLRELRGPVLFVSNHITRRADIGLILAALPAHYRNRLATAMGGETLREMRNPPGTWNVIKRWVYQLGYWTVTALFNVFPLPQFSGFRESFRFAGESVDRGYSILVFPEGEVNNSETGEMAEFRSGIALLSENLGIPIVPMRLDGVWKMKREHRRLARPGEVTVRIGAPMKFPQGVAPEEISRALGSMVLGL